MAPISSGPHSCRVALPAYTGQSCHIAHVADSISTSENFKHYWAAQRVNAVAAAISRCREMSGISEPLGGGRHNECGKRKLPDTWKCTNSSWDVNLLQRWNPCGMSASGWRHARVRGPPEEQECIGPPRHTLHEAHIRSSPFVLTTDVPNMPYYFVPKEKLRK